MKWPINRCAPGTSPPSSGEVDYGALEQAMSEASWGVDEPAVALMPARCVCGMAGIAMISVVDGVLAFGEVTDTGEIVAHACKKILTSNEKGG